MNLLTELEKNKRIVIVYPLTSSSEESSQTIASYFMNKGKKVLISSANKIPENNQIYDIIIYTDIIFNDIFNIPNKLQIYTTTYGVDESLICGLQTYNFECLRKSIVTYTINESFLTEEQEKLYEATINNRERIENLDVTIRNHYLKSSKFSQLIQFVIFYPHEKHIVVTKFEDIYGIQTIKSFLEEEKIPHFEILKSNSKEQSNSIIDSFNNSPKGVLIISNHNFKHLPFKVRHIHIIDNLYSYILPLIHVSYIEPRMIVHLYVAKSRNFKTLDVENYDLNKENIIKYCRSWNDMIRKSIFVNINS